MSSINSSSSDKSTKLNNELIELLEGLNKRKSRIDQQVKFLTNLPKILPFEPLPPNQSNISRKTWEIWWSEHDRIELEAGIFREDEFALMKKVAMSKTTNMSREDTDLVGLTLCTLDAFSKLEHLLRSRRKQLQILDLRIKWDQQTGKVWQDLNELESELPNLLSRIRWSPPLKHPVMFSSPHQSSVLSLPTTVSSSPNPSSSHSSPSFRTPLSRSLRSRKEGIHQHPPFADFSSFNPTQSVEQTATPDGKSFRRSSYHTHSADTIPPPPDSSTAPILLSNPPSQPDLNSVPSNARDPGGCIRASSVPTFPAGYTSSIAIPPSTSAQSRAMRIQSLTLQLSSITTKFHTLNRSVVPTSTTIDKLIDSGLHVPEIFLDLQDQLEAAVRRLQPTETGKFYMALMEQYKEADDVWFNLFHLELEIDSFKREVDALLAATKVDPNHLTKFEAQLSRLSDKYASQRDRTRLRILPVHTNHPDQTEFNTRLVEDLVNNSQVVKVLLHELEDLVKVYRFATDASQQAQTLRAFMEDLRVKLTLSIKDLESLNEAYPNRAWLINSPSCLTSDSQDEEYETKWQRIMAELSKHVLDALKLIGETPAVLQKLNSPGSDPNLKSEFQQIRDGLKKVIDQAQQISINKEQSVSQLEQVRTIWRRILEVQTELGRLHDQLLLVAYREKWRMRKVSSPSQSLPIDTSDCDSRSSVPSPSVRQLPSLEDLRCAASRPPNLFHSPQEAQEYLLTSLQPQIKSVLAELSNDSSHHTVHQHLLGKVDELLNDQVPGLRRLELTIQLIRQQTGQVQKLESEYDAKIIEGGRWMKKVQDLISMELEHTYEEVDEVIDPLGLKPRSEEKSTQARVMSQLAQYLSAIDHFCDSFSNRVQFIATGHSDALVMHSGRLVLQFQAHDQSVRSHLNGLSMTMMGLKDQISNELSLLEWINSPHVKEFEQAVNQVAKEIKLTDTKLDEYEANLKRIQQLIESDPLEPFLTENQIEQTIDQALREFRNTLNEIEIQLGQSASVQLEAFISSCPNPSISQAFKPDQFILPKQMSHHRLQALYNQVSRRLEDNNVLSLKFKDGTNATRKQEFSWREAWVKRIEELIGDCKKLGLELSTVDSQSIKVEQESYDWGGNRFKAEEQAKLLVLDDPRSQEHLEQIASYEFRLSRSQETLDTIKENLESVDRQASTVRSDIEEKLPVFLGLMNGLTTQLSQLRDHWSKSHELGLRVSSCMIRLKQGVDSFLEEFERRLGWKTQCLQITAAELQTVGDSFVRFDESLDQVVKLWDSSSNHKSRDEIEKTTHTLLDCLRSFDNLKTAELVPTQSHLEQAQTKLFSINQEILALSTKDTPHPYLAETEAEVESKARELRQRSTNFEELEKELLQHILRLSRQYELCLVDRLEQEIVWKHCESENARLTTWKHDLDQFIDSVQAEYHQLEQLRLMNEVFPPQTDNECQLQSLHTLRKAIVVLSDSESDAKDNLVKIEGISESISDMSQRLKVLDVNETQLANQIDLFRRTLPGNCSEQLEEILCPHHPSQAIENKPNRFEEASIQLRETHSHLKVLGCHIQDRLGSIKEHLKKIQNHIAHSNSLSHLLDRVSQLELDKWIDVEGSSAHSPLPTPEILDQVMRVLDEAENEIVKLSPIGLGIGQLSSGDIIRQLENHKRNAETLRHLVRFQSAISSCDQAFSTLLDYLDIRRTDTSDDQVRDLTNSASKALAVLLKTADPVRADPRVKYHITRSKQTWEELESLTKDVNVQTDRLSQSLNGSVDHPQPSKLPLFSRTSAVLPGLMDTPPTSNSRRGSFIPRLKHSSDLAMSRFGSSIMANSPTNGLLDSPSHGLGRRHEAPRASDPISNRANRMLPKSESDTLISPTRSLSRQSEGKNSRSMIGNPSSRRERPRLQSMQGTPTRYSTTKLLSHRSSPRNFDVAPNSHSTPIVYRPQPNRNIDRLVGNVVNRLARNQLSVHVAPAEGWEDNSGMYWIGEKIYFCRILRSQTVMVRIGGGWSELSVFLMEHLRLTTPASSKNTQLELRTAGGSERLSTMSPVKSTSSENLANTSLLPSATLSSHSSCYSSPNTTQTISNVGSVDSITSTPTSSIATTVLITTPQEIRTSHPPSSYERAPTLSQSALQSKPFLSTPTETIQMFLRKAENRNYLTNNYTNSPTNYQSLHSNGLVGDPINSSSNTKLNRVNFGPGSSSLTDSNSLSPLAIKAHHSNSNPNLNPSISNRNNSSNNSSNCNNKNSSVSIRRS